MKSKYGLFFEGVFLTLDEYYPKEIVHEMHADTIKMLDKFLDSDLDSSVLKPDLIRWVNSDILDTVATYNTLSGICSCGALELAKWYVKTYSNPLGVHEQNELAFRWACRNGHLKLAEWFLETFPETDIKAKNNYAFRWAFRNGHANTAKWLLLKQGKTTFKGYPIKLNANRSS